MNYYALLGIIKEPFASSPDPDLFFYSVQHHDCLQKLELALRLRRGLSVVVGDIGTGKSTMCRTLVRMLDDDRDAVSAHIFLDPAFTSPSEFLAAIIAAFSIKDDCDSEWQMKEAIKNYLLHQGVSARASLSADRPEEFLIWSRRNNLAGAKWLKIYNHGKTRVQKFYGKLR